MDKKRNYETIAVSFEIIKDISLEWKNWFVKHEFNFSI